jgi:hypothetical protein
MPQTSLLVAMDFSESEPGQMIMEHALVGLSREELFAPHNWACDGPSVLQQRGYNGPEQGLIVEPTRSGVELFLNALGGGHLPLNAFLLQGTSIPPIEGVMIPSGSFSLQASNSSKETGRAIDLPRRAFPRGKETPGTMKPKSPPAQTPQGMVFDVNLPRVILYHRSDSEYV